MGKGFWIRRFGLAFVVTAAVLLLAEIVKGHALGDALRFALFWAAITAALFTLAGYIRYRRNPACMLPRNRES